MNRRLFIFMLFVTLGANFFITKNAPAESPLSPVKLETPRDTMRTFMTAMNQYRRHSNSDRELAERALKRAIRTMNLDGIAALPEERGRESAIFLKEVIDRIIVIDYERIPLTIATGEPPWRLKGTEISIGRIESGDRLGQYLFTKDTVRNARSWFEEINHLPYLPGSGMGAGYAQPWLQTHVPRWLQEKWLIFHNWQWLGLLLSIFFGLLFRSIGTFLSRMVQRATQRLQYRWWHEAAIFTERPLGLAAACGFWFFSIHLLAFDGAPYIFLQIVVQVILSIALIWAAYCLVDVLSDYLAEKAKATESTLDDHIMPLVQKSLRSFTIIFGILLVFQNLGVNVMSVLAGLGLGGLAFALAAKDTCANLFGSLMILMDRPFHIGDWIKINGVDGTVEEIGFRCTRVRTFYNSQVSIPNSVIVNENIDNYGRREYRRINAKLGVTYDTSPEKLEAFCEGIKRILQANPYVRQDLYHVVFNAYQADSLEILLYCFLKVSNWSEELVERQNIYLEILRLAKELSVEFAFPTQTLHVESFPGHEPRSKAESFSTEELQEKAASFGPSGVNSKPSGLGIYTPAWRETN